MDFDHKAVFEALPENLEQQWLRLISRTVENNKELTITLLGAFSAGKTTLINMLLGEEHLPTGADETTGVPTFISYGEKLTRGYSVDGESWEEIGEEKFRAVTAAAGEEGSFTTLEAPQGWLRGYQLVDLPGVGGTDIGRRGYIRAQIDSADVVVYVLAPRGPTREDVEYLEYAAKQGKAIKLVVSQWDRILGATEAGEPDVDLGDWEEQIEKATAIEQSVLPVSIEGHGRDELIEALGKLEDTQEEIRISRFIAEAKPLLEGAIGYLDEKRHAIQLESQEERLKLEEKLRERRERLLELKEEILNSRESHREKAKRLLGTGVKEIREELDTRVARARELAGGDIAEKEWREYINALNDAGDSALSNVVERVRDIHSELNSDEELSSQWSQVSLGPPDVEPVERDTWMESAQLQRIEESLMDLVEDLESGKQQLPATVPSEVQQELVAEIRSLRSHKNEVASSELETIEKRTGGGNAGKITGRVVGEVIDIGLLVVQPQFVATKIASVFGKGAKAVKVGKTTANALKVVQNAKKGDLLMKGVPPESPVRKVGQHISHLEKLSVGYWGQRLGSQFDSPPEVIYEVDPEAMKHRNAMLSEFDKKIDGYKNKLRKLERQREEREMTEYALELKARKKAELERQLAKAKERAAKEEQKYERSRAEYQRERMQLEADKAARHTVDNFNRAVRGIERRLMQEFKEYWDVRMKETLQSEKDHLDKLQTAMKKAPEEKREFLSELEQRREIIRDALNGLVGE